MRLPLSMMISKRMINKSVAIIEISFGGIFMINSENSALTDLQRYYCIGEMIL